MSTGGTTSFQQIIQEQEDEKLAHQLQHQQQQQQQDEERLFLDQLELAQQLSLAETQTPSSVNTDKADINEDAEKDDDEEEDGEEDESDGQNIQCQDTDKDYFVERQKKVFSHELTVIPKEKTKQEKPQQNPKQGPTLIAQFGILPGEGSDVSTSCGRVYKNRVPRPITTGAHKTRANGPLEVERDTGVPGLFLVYNFLSEPEETQIYESIQGLQWSTNRAQTRRVQLYVPWEENPKFVIVPKATIMPMPQCAKDLATRITFLGREHFPQYSWDIMRLAEDRYCELQINEYRTADALGFHKDNVTAYTEVICGVSLLADCWIHYQYLKEEVKVLIPKRSLYLLTGKARYKWKHGIPPESLVGGEKRISFTYRSVVYTKRSK